jgi:hypothetical protein
MARGRNWYTVTIPNNTALGTTITDENGNAVKNLPLGGRALGVVIVPDSWTAAQIGLKVSVTNSDDADDFKPLLNENGSYDSGGTAPTCISGIDTTDGQAYFAPARWAGAPFALLHSVTASSGVDANQTGAKVLKVFIKD